MGMTCMIMMPPVVAGKQAATCPPVLIFIGRQAGILAQKHRSACLKPRVRQIKKERQAVSIHSQTIKYPTVLLHLFY